MDVEYTLLTGGGGNVNAQYMILGVLFSLTFARAFGFGKKAMVMIGRGSRY